MQKIKFRNQISNRNDIPKENNRIVMPWWQGEQRRNRGISRHMISPMIKSLWNKKKIYICWRRISVGKKEYPMVEYYNQNQRFAGIGKWRIVWWRNNTESRWAYWKRQKTGTGIKRVQNDGTSANPWSMERSKWNVHTRYDWRRITGKHRLYDGTSQHGYERSWV